MAYPQSMDPLINSWGGIYGVDYFSDTDTHTGDWTKIVAKGATEINSLTSLTWSTAPATLADGEAIYGIFTAIDLTSGAVYCYRSARAQS